MRMIKLNVGNKTIGESLTWAYPGGAKLGYFTIPTYELTVSGYNDSGKQEMKRFEVLRFGLKSENGGTPVVVGLADQQTHAIKVWLPHYTVHSARSKECGAWQVYDNFLIHDGPDNPKKEVYASVGCIEICNGPSGFDTFNDYIISLSGSAKSTRSEKLRDIGNSRKMIITYQKAIRPSYNKAP
jgi:hypothetical protein